MFTHFTAHPKRTVLGVGLLAAITAAFLLQLRPAVAADAAKPGATAGRGVACLGRISPRDGIVRLSPAASSYPGVSPIGSLRHKEGESVKAGQILAVLESQPRLESTWRAATAQAKVAESRLAQVLAGASATERAAQQAQIDELALLVEAARLQHARSEALKRDSAIAPAGFENTQLALETRQKALEAARARLKRMQEIPEVDVAAARAQFEAAQAEADRAKAELEQAYVRAPADGVIVRICAQVGERPGPDGVLEFATVDPMYVIAEVDESDVRRIQAGQRVNISGVALPGPLTGKVEHIGTKVGRNSLYSPDPASASDNRVVEVRIRLDDASVAQRFLQATVTVLFPL